MKLSKKEKQLEKETIRCMREVGIDEGIIYAYKKTGRIVTSKNIHLLSEEEKKEWNNAIKEFDCK